MRDALILTDRNLTSFIGSRDNLGMTADNTVVSKALTGWRGVVRKALGHRVERADADCPVCSVVAATATTTTA